MIKVYTVSISESGFQLMECAAYNLVNYRIHNFMCHRRRKIYSILCDIYFQKALLSRFGIGGVFFQTKTFSFKLKRCCCWVENFTNLQQSLRLGGSFFISV